MSKVEQLECVAYGAGFIALDVVVDREEVTEARFAGGTCGNVMAILAFLGWRSVPIARLSEDQAGKLVRADLQRWGVDLRQLGLQPQAPTPIVVEEIYLNRSGHATHRYVWTCPHCGSYLPQFRPVPAKSLEGLLNPAASQVFFFDRLSRSSLTLARHFSEQGAVVVFEPSGSSDARLFREALRICHVLKYSSQRVRSFADLLRPNKAWLEIETLGEEGLRYRTTLPLCERGWKHVVAFEVDTLRDAAGSGDWCTAGILSKVAQHGQESLAVVTSDSLHKAFRYGQALSAWNCRFPGPRGGMYLSTRASMTKIVEEILAGESSSRRLRSLAQKGQKSEAAAFCPTCTGSTPAESRDRALTERRTLTHR